MAIKLEMLRTFCAVARAGNLAQAAASLGRSQAALSMMLKQFEEELGQALFETDRKSRLSDFGERVFDLAKQEVAHFEQTLSALDGLSQNPLGSVRCAAIPSVSGAYFPQVLAQMQREFPNLHMDMRDSDSRQILDWLLQGQIDIGVAAISSEMDGVARQLLIQDRLGLVCRADHPLAQIGALSIRDILSADYVHNPVVKDMLEDQDTGGAPYVHNSFTILSMVAAGPWVAILPKTILRAAYADVVFREIADLDLQRDVYFYHRHGTAQAAHVAGFYAHLMAAVQGG